MKRYEPDIETDFDEHPTGEWVRYDDRLTPEERRVLEACRATRSGTLKIFSAGEGGIGEICIAALALKGEL